jgi:hypothetical protein
MQSPELRDRLLNALAAIELTRPPSFRAAFDFLAIYLPGIRPVHDAELASAFRRVISAVEEAADLGHAHAPGEPGARSPGR